MPNLVIAATDVAPVRYEQSNAHSDVSVEAINAGQYCRIDVATGRIALGNATSAAEVGRGGGIAIKTAVTGGALSVVRRGLVDVGNALNAMAYGAVVFISDTDGTFADSAGTVSTVVGYVHPGGAESPRSKLLMLTVNA